MTLKPISLFRGSATELLEAAVRIERESQKTVPDLHHIDELVTLVLRALSKVHKSTHLTK